MLFDLQGPRKTFVKVIYLGLALLLGGGLVLFGIGSDVNGGLADIFGSKSSLSQAQDNVEKYEKQVAANPKSKTALETLIAARYTLAADEANFNKDKNTFSKEGEAALKQLTKDWNTYLKLVDNKPSLATANYAVSAYLGLNDAKGATKAQEILTKAQPNAANYLALMLYASYAGDTLIASGAEVRAKELATKDEKQAVADQIKEIKEQMKERSAEIQQQIQEQFKQQAQQSQTGGTPTSPFGGAAAPSTTK
jgi:dihydroxyacetone kinase